MTWTCHVDESTKIRHTMIIGIYLPTALGIDIKFSKKTYKAV